MTKQDRSKVPDEMLRSWARSGRTLDEIATLYEKRTGWRPTKSRVSQMLREIGEPSRRRSHRDLMPQHVLPEHASSRLRFMLQAESNQRQKQKLTRNEERAIDLMNDLLFGRGTPLVIAYHPEIGFYLTERTKEDKDIVRKPQQVPASRPQRDGAARQLDFTLPDKELVAQAVQLSATPEMLENRGRDTAADRLRKLLIASGDAAQVATPVEQVDGVPREIDRYQEKKTGR